MAGKKEKTKDGWKTIKRDYGNFPVCGNSTYFICRVMGSVLKCQCVDCFEINKTAPKKHKTRVDCKLDNRLIFKNA